MFLEQPPGLVCLPFAYVCEAGLDPQFLQAILAHTRIHSTLDEYSHVGLDELKRRFAALDLADGPEVGGGGREEARVLLEQLRPLGPEGKERAWAQLVEGLLGFI